MKTLLLLRHAKSSWCDSQLTDFDRPLAKRGKHDAPLIGSLLAERGVLPDLVLCSPAKRAAATMELVSRAAAITGESLVFDRRLYEADCDSLLRIVHELDDCYCRVMLCGHNPGLAEFCDFLLPETLDSLPTCALVVMTFPVDHWHVLAPGTGTFLYAMRPKELRVL
jgi:phosphohistidine phosphatase